MRNITLEELLEAGCHFGHQVNRRNPKADEYIFEARNGVHIINLEATRDGLIEAGKFVANVALQGGTFLIVGTKRQAKNIIEDEVRRAKEAGAEGLYYITTRWIGGVLTNYSEVSKNFKRLQELTTFLAGTNREGYTKREVLLMEREKEKLMSFYSGVVHMTKIPDAVFILDIHSESTAVDEARKMHVPIVGISDTNADPTLATRAIPSNDDAVGAIRLITNYIADAWIEGKAKAKQEAEKQAVKEAKEKEKAEKKAPAKKETK